MRTSLFRSKWTTSLDLEASFRNHEASFTGSLSVRPVEMVFVEEIVSNVFHFNRNTEGSDL